MRDSSDPFKFSVIGPQIEEVYSRLYEEGSITTAVDSLPYTDDMEELYAAMVDLYPDITRHTTYHALKTLRKKGMGTARQRVRDPQGDITLQQRRILKVLALNPGGLSAKDLALLSDVNAIRSLVGPKSKDELSSMGRVGKLCLLGRQMVSVDLEDGGLYDVAVFSITDKGREALRNGARRSRGWVDNG